LWDLKKRIPLNSLYINVFLLHLLCFKKKGQFNFLLVIPNENNIIKKKKEKRKILQIITNGKAHSLGLYLLHSSLTNMPSPLLDQSWGS
jgi:hypothetical protein